MENLYIVTRTLGGIESHGPYHEHEERDRMAMDIIDGKTSVPWCGYRLDVMLYLDISPEGELVNTYCMDRQDLARVMLTP